MSRATLLSAAIVLLVAALAGCASNNAPPATTTSTTSSTVPTNTGPNAFSGKLTGDGSTFVAPLMDKWRLAFGDAHPGSQVSYQGVGSGQGRKDITANTVDFAASDAPMSNGELANASDVLHIPIAAGAVAIGYNLPEIAAATPLTFDASTLAGIYLGKIVKWNDPAIAALNPSVSLPDKAISVVYRADSSGTTNTFTDYLTKASPSWQKPLGPGTTSVTTGFPVGSGAKGNPGVGTQIQNIPYTIGYIGAEWGNISQLHVGLVKNKVGAAVAPTPAAASAALESALAANAFDERLRGSATNADGATAYPITAVSWLLVHKEQGDANKGRELAAFAWYVIHEGQALNAKNSYAAIPASMVQKAEALIDSMASHGAKLR